MSFYLDRKCEAPTLQYCYRLLTVYSSYSNYSRVLAFYLTHKFSVYNLYKSFAFQNIFDTNRSIAPHNGWAWKTMKTYLFQASRRQSDTCLSKETLIALALSLTKRLEYVKSALVTPQSILNVHYHWDVKQNVWYYWALKCWCCYRLQNVCWLEYSSTAGYESLAEASRPSPMDVWGASLVTVSEPHQRTKQENTLETDEPQ